MKKGEEHDAGSEARAFLWGAAHALDLGGVLVEEEDWGGLEADARAISGDWRTVLSAAEQEPDVAEESKTK